MRIISLLLADSRLPSGAHAHSSGVEQAVDAGVIRDCATLKLWLEGRLATGITTEACACAMAWHATRSPDAIGRLGAIAAEVDARLVAPAAREVSHQQGARYVRTVASVLALGQPLPCGERPHLCLAVGVTAAEAGLGCDEAVAITIYQTLSGSASAALRLLGLDPVTTSAVVAALDKVVARINEQAVANAADDPRTLPALQSPALDFLLELHYARSERLFAS